MAEDKGKKDEEKDKDKAEAPAEGDAAAAEGAPKKSKKKLIIIIVGALVLVGAIVGGLMAAGIIGGSSAPAEEHGKAGHGKEGEHGEGAALDKDPCLEPASGGGEKKEEKIDPCKPVYVDVQDLIVNLTSESRRQHFVNLRITLELKNAEGVPEIENNMPRIIDSFNTYLREMTKEDLEGSEGLIRLEDEMMLRLNKILKPGTVTDILYRSVIVQ